ncbi:MAG: DivIVA domain-containing protein, partial [Nitrospinota bacterium]
SDMKKTLLAAQTLKEEISANARKESELIIRDARAKASEIIGSTKTAATGIQEELAALQRRKKQLILNIRSMLETHLRMLEAEEKSDLAFPIEPVRREPADAKGAEGQDESEPAPKPARPEAAPKKTKPPLPVSLRNDPLDT